MVDEEHRRRVSLDNLRRIAEALNVPVASLGEPRTSTAARSRITLSQAEVAQAVEMMRSFYSLEMPASRARCVAFVQQELANEAAASPSPEPALPPDGTRDPSGSS